MNDFSVHAAMHAAVCPAGFIASDKASAAWLPGLLAPFYVGKRLWACSVEVPFRATFTFSRGWALIAILMADASHGVSPDGMW